MIALAGKRAKQVRATTPYPKIEVRGHPLAQGDGRVPVHRLVAASMEGVDAVAGKLVHHIDGNPANNHSSNLQIVTVSEHGRIHNGWKRLDDGTWLKPCFRCQHFYPANSSYFHKGSKGAEFCSWCKSCCLNYNRVRLGIKTPRAKPFENVPTPLSGGSFTSFSTSIGKVRSL